MASPTPVAINALNISTFSVYGGDKELCEGPRILPVLAVDFSKATTYTFDYSNQMKTGRISRIQTLFIDASALSSGSVSVTFTTGQVITCKGATQGYFYCLAQEPFKVSMTSATAGLVSFIFMNFTVEPAQWLSQ